MERYQSGMARWTPPGRLAASTIATGSGTQVGPADDPPEPRPEK